jgi:hypothetical protein
MQSEKASAILEFGRNSCVVFAPIKSYFRNQSLHISLHVDDQIISKEPGWRLTQKYICNFPPPIYDGKITFYIHKNNEIFYEFSRDVILNSTIKLANIKRVPFVSTENMPYTVYFIEEDSVSSFIARFD